MSYRMSDSNTRVATLFARFAAIHTTISALEQRYAAIPAVDLTTPEAREMREMLWDGEQEGFTDISNLLATLEEMLRIYSAKRTMTEPDERFSHFLTLVELGKNMMEELLGIVEAIVAEYEDVMQDRIEQTVEDLADLMESEMN
ncbi:hypothetical protein K470DRAFT_274249 [Piedraia hortae CBS 480.64]|uniref:Uncharacterized protein n=1 Tax=Piedraia hortae CBS 480.64 TaxID=1314780 RepID=A0A6A7C8B4_9PEZI|nr:hypothetical protein K470DRAFT_274249 [Piedraia hortae CBS 480.64]